MRALSIYTVLLALLISMPAAAQHPQRNGPPEGQAMMHGGMNGMMQNMQTCMMIMQSMHGGAMGGMQDGSARMHVGMMNGGGEGGMVGMMEQPMHRSMMLVHVLPTMQEPLDLNDTQISRLETFQEDALDAHRALREQMHTAHSQLRELAGQEDADPSEVETLLKSAAERHAEMQASMFAAAQNMRNVLSAEQQAELADMQPADIHRHMMQNMSMMEMMEMMQQMHGGMMQGGSMGPPMQNRGPQDHQGDQGRMR